MWRSHAVAYLLLALALFPNDASCARIAADHVVTPDAEPSEVHINRHLAQATAPPAASSAPLVSQLTSLLNNVTGPGRPVTIKNVEAALFIARAQAAALPNGEIVSDCLR